MNARVYLVGAGPGDPGLITVKGAKCIRMADVVVYDRLVDPSLLALARPDAEIIYVGKASSAHTMKQEEINLLLAEKALEGKTVCRLKGGDPFVFGRGGEEAEALREKGIEFEIVPGVTSAIAVPAYAGIPVTHRGVAASFAVITGHEQAVSTESAISHQPSAISSEETPSSAPADGPPCQGGQREDSPPYKGGAGEAGGGSEKPQTRINWEKLATGVDTLVFLMGVENLPNIVGELVKHGRDPQTPVALVRWGTTPRQETLTGTLADIVEKAESIGFKSPAVTVVGDVVNLRETLRWFDNRPLFGRRVLVTRSREQASELCDLLRRYGADPVEFPVIKTVPPDSFVELDDALARIEKYDWLIFTSANAVPAVVDRLRELGRDVRALKGPKVGAIGPKTAETITALGVRVDFTPSEFVAEAVVREFPEDPRGKSILIPRAKEAREVIREKLKERGARVDVVAAYETVMEYSEVAKIKDLFEMGQIDIVTFTSSSTVKNFARLLGTEGKVSLPEGVRVACIGPITAQTAEEIGLRPDIVAQEYTIEGLVRAMVAGMSDGPEVES